MAKKTYKAKEPIALRQKALKNGNKSLYLDIYQNGTRSYEFLKLYLIPEHTPEDKKRNLETLRLATAVKAKRITLLQDGAFNFKPTQKGNILLTEYLERERERFLKRGSNAYAQSIHNTIKHILNYGDSKLNAITKDYLQGFAEYLKNANTKYGTPLSANSQSLYYDVVAIALNRAVKDDLIQANPSHKIDGKDRPKPTQSNRVYLSMEELQLLKKTTARVYGGDTKRYSKVQKAFFFSCFTGLRYSDIITLKWEDIKTLPDGGKQIAKTMQKTKENVIIDLSPNALNYLPTKRKNTQNNELIFSLPRVDVVWDMLQDWAARAGLQKHISFHTARHTFATLGIFYGADVYTMQKLLGHKNINTTQIYAKVVEESKRKAVNLIPKL